MSETDRPVRATWDEGQMDVDGDGGHIDEGLDVQAALTWVRRNQVLAVGLILIAAQLAWKAQFLTHLYFTQDDFYNLNLAIQSHLSWHYLTFIGIGHLMIGPRAVAWVLARISLYDWGLASSVVLVLLAGANIAALRLLRTLFGDRRLILALLAVYLLTPLTVPDLGWWSAAMESVPLQLAIFMALNAHVWYVRTGRARHLVAALAWVGFGLLFFEKALVLPVLLFAVTAAFLTGGRSWLAGARLALVRFWRAWLAYALLMGGYAVLLAVSLRTSPIHPQAPTSVGATLTFAWGLVRDTLLPGAIGGPWQWYPIFGGSYSIGAPPTALIWLAMIVVAVVLSITTWRRRIAWRSWAILAGWVVLADMVPVLIGGRLIGWSLGLHKLDTHYLADAAPALAICLGLALCPLADQQKGGSASLSRRQNRPDDERFWPMAAAALSGVFFVGSIWSVQAYESVTSGLAAATYIANARQALDLAPRGTAIVTTLAPAGMVNWGLGRYQFTSALIGDLARGKLARQVRWVSHPAGTIDGLMIFGSDGRLYPAQLNGVASADRSAKQGCWPERHGQIVVRFAAPTSIYAWELRIGYIWYPATPGFLTVQYGKSVQPLKVLHGLHSAYLPISGSASNIIVRGLSSPQMCIGDVEAGGLAP